MKRKAEDDFHSILGEGKPYALRKRIRVAELENTRDTEMSSYQEKTSSGVSPSKLVQLQHHTFITTEDSET